MVNKRVRLLIWMVLEVVFLALIIISTVYDFDISQALLNVKADNGTLVSSSTPIWTTVVKVISEWPAVLLISFSVLVLVQAMRKRAQQTSILLLILLLDIVAAFIVYTAFAASVDDICGNALGALGYVLSAVLALAVTFFLRKAAVSVCKATVKTILLPASVTAVTGIAIIAITYILKLIWGRYGLAEIVRANDLSMFTGWFKLHPFDTAQPFFGALFSRASSSFPSLQIAYAAFMLILPIWFSRNADKKSVRNTAIIVTVWIILVCLSRVFSGELFLSDAVFGFAVSFVIVQIGRAQYEKTFYSDFSPTSETLEMIAPVSPEEDEEIEEKPASNEIRKEKKSLRDTGGFKSTMFETKEHPKVVVDNSKPSEDTGRHASLPARESIPETVNLATPTSFSLARARAEKEEFDTLTAEQSEIEAQRLDEQLKAATTGELKLNDISTPVIPKTKAARAKAAKKKKKKTTIKKAAPKKQAGNNNSVQMHFKYDDQNHSITSDLSDE